MKTQKTILKASMMVVLAFVLMFGTHGLAAAESGANLGSTLIENRSSNVWPGIPGYQDHGIRQSAIGSYTLIFYARRVGMPIEETSSMPAGSGEMILRAYVADSSGVPAQVGTAVFEYCSYKGGPTNDPDRADEAPMEACDNARVATWRRLWSLQMGTCGSLGAGACLNFGGVRFPRVVGFRFQFRSGRSGIDPGFSEPANFTWTADL